MLSKWKLGGFATAVMAMFVLGCTGCCANAADAPAATNSHTEFCAIQVVDEETGWPVPMVELHTLHNVRFVSDNAGMIAFDLPELMGCETWFNVRAHGYGVAADGFGMRGVRLTPEPGKTLHVKVKRSIIAKRLGRLTGSGLFAESQKLGLEKDWRESGELGCDSIQMTEHNGKLFWAWGDTVLARYPLGVFHMTAAISEIPPFASFEPPIRPPHRHFTAENGIPRKVAQMPGGGPSWLMAFASLPDSAGTNHLVASYYKVRGQMESYKIGLCVWNETTENFEMLREIWNKTEETPKPPLFPRGHTVKWTDDTGCEWVLFGNPLPNSRCPATFEAWQDESSWEALEPQKEFVSASDGKPIKPHSGSIAWSPYRKRWVTVFMQHFGEPSAFGELWYAEADAPTGPWGKAVKVLSHDNYTFYNPRVHAESLTADSPVLLFEGTYTSQFTSRAHPTPRYDYTQLLYRLDLDDPALEPVQQPADNHGDGF